jgi:L-fuculose-phosphate aldolase
MVRSSTKGKDEVTARPPTVTEARRAVVTVCRRLYERGLIAGQDGNVSVRIGARILVTPAGTSKVDVRANELIVLGADGTKVSGRGTASSEVQVHLAAYAARPDVGAVVHAHPPTATGFAVAGVPLDYDALAEMVYNVGRVPIVPYAPPGSREVANLVAKALDGADVVLMANHGAVAVGPTVTVAHQRMESLEHAARILLAARQLGRVTRLTRSEVRALESARTAVRSTRISR